MARPQRVLILYGNALFATSIKSLLEKEEGLDVAIEEALDPKGYQVLMSFRPHVLITEENVALSQKETDYIRRRTPTVIHLSLEDTTMRISHKQQISSASAQDLLEAIRSRRPTRRRRQRQEQGPDVRSEVEHD